MKITTLVIVIIIIGVIYYYSKIATAATINNVTGGYLMPEDMTPLDIAGGLFPNGSNQPTATQLSRIQDSTNAITPLDTDGYPSAEGKIGFLAVGASNPTKEFNAFIDLCLDDDATNEDVDYVNGCIGGVAIEDMNTGASAVGDYFQRLKNTVTQAGCSPNQVQVIWFKSDCLTLEMWNMSPDEYVNYFADQFTITLQKLYEAFPNLQIVYTSGRNNPYVEDTSDVYMKHGGPRAYLNQLGYREVMSRQTTGGAGLNCVGADKVAPVLTWSTPLYTEPRGTENSFGHVWNPEDVISDGVHPTDSTGAPKVAQLLKDFFSTDANAQKWFLG